MKTLGQKKFMLNSPTVVSRILGFNINEDNKKNQDIVTYNNEGSPDSYHDLWLENIEGEDDSWLSRDSKNLVSNTKRIIISDLYLKFLEIKGAAIKSHTELLTFLSTIIDTYQVYLWENKNLNQCKRIRSLQELLENRNRLIPARSESVIEALSQQGIDTKAIKVLDYAAFSQLTDEDSHIFYFYNNNSLDLTNLNIDDNDWENQIINGMPKTINKIYLHFSHANKIASFRDKVSQVELIISVFKPEQIFEVLYSVEDQQLGFLIHDYIGQADEELTITDHISTLSFDACVISSINIKSTDKLILKNSEIKVIDIEDTTYLKKLVIEKSNISSLDFVIDNLDYFKTDDYTEYENEFLESASHIGTLAISSTKNLKIDLPACEIDELILDYCIDIEEINIKNSSVKSIKIVRETNLDFLANFPNLEVLTLACWTKKPLKVDNLPIKNLTIDAAILELTISNLPNIENLNLENCYQVQPFDLKKFCNLKSLKMKSLHFSNVETFPLLDLSDLQYLKSIYLADVKFNSINVSNCRNLQKVSLDTLLISLNLTNCFSLNQLNLANMPDTIIGRPEREDLTINILQIEKEIKTIRNIDALTREQAEYIVNTIELQNYLLIDDEHVLTVLRQALKLLNKPCIKVAALDMVLNSQANLANLPIDNLSVKALNLDLKAYESGLKKLDIGQFSHVKQVVLYTFNSEVNEICNIATTVEVLSITNFPIEILDLVKHDKLISLTTWATPALKQVIFPVDCNLQLLNIDAKKCDIEFRSNKIIKIHLEVASAKLNITDAPIADIVINTRQNEDDHANILISNCQQLTTICSNTDVSLNSVNNLKLLKVPAKTLQDYHEHIPKYCRTVSVTKSNNFISDKEVSKDNLNRINEKRRSAIYSMNSGMLNLSRKIENYDDYEAEGEIAFNVLTRSDLSPSYYILFEFNEVKCVNGKLEMVENNSSLHEIKIKTQSFTNDTLKEWLLVNKQNKSAKQLPEYIVMAFEAPLHDNVIYTLPNVQTVTEDTEIEIMINDFFNRDIVFMRGEGREGMVYKFKLDPLAKKLPFKMSSPLKTTIYYRVKTNDFYHNLPKNLAPIQVSTQNLLPEDIRHFLMNKISRLANNHPIVQLFRLIESPLEFLTALIEYCNIKTFKVKSLTTTPDADLDFIWQVIDERKGVCAHRALAFFLLARLGGVPVNLPASEDHAFITIPYLVNNQICSAMYCMGGAPSRNLTKSDKYIAVYKRAVAKTKNNRVNFVQVEDQNSKLTTDEKHWLKVYSNKFDEYLNEDVLNNVEHLMEVLQDGEPPIINLDSKELVTLTTCSIINYLKQYHQPFVFIDQFKLFKQYLKPLCYENGQRVILDGPLLKIIQEGGYIIVNTSKFNDLQITNFKSVFDDAATLLTESICDRRKVKIITLTDKLENFDFDTLTRTKTWTISNNFIFDSHEDSTMDIDCHANSLEIDCFSTPYWREKLLGDIKFEGKDIHIKEGKIIAALHHNQNLIIYNPPINDNDFESLVFRIQKVKEFLYVGKNIAVNKDFKIEIKNKEHKQNSNQLQIVNADADDYQKIYISLQNIHQLTESIFVDNTTHMASVTTGLLDTYDHENGCLYITQSLPVSEWELMIHKIEERFPGRHFRVALAPGVAIGNILQNENQPKTIRQSPLEELKQNVIVSDDPDCLSQLLYEKYNKNTKTYLFDISEVTTAKDILYKITKKDGFAMHEQKVLRLLKKGRTVILNGAINDSLYNQLLPLLASPPSIFINGKKQELKGRLICVMPKEIKYQPIASSQVNFEFEHYAQLQLLAPEDIELAQKIKKFHDLVLKLPHEGKGRPPKPKLNYQRLRQFLYKLRHGDVFNSQNPIKGLMLYDYPYKSDDYFYLNVMAKCIFASEYFDMTKQIHKLNTIVSEYQINIDDKKSLLEHVWKLINCFDGQFITKILANDLSNVDTSLNFPTVNDITLTRLQDFLKTSLSSEQQISKKIHNEEKPILQFKQLLLDPFIHFIFLKGGPGTGKSYAVRQLETEFNIKLYEGMEELLVCLQDKTNKRKILLLDEGNTELPGKLEALKGIRNGKIFCEGKPYSTEGITIAVTGNYEDLDERYYHDVLREYGEIILFKPLEDAMLTKRILRPVLEEKMLAVVPLMLTAYHLIKDTQRNFEFSSRALANLARRFLLKAENAKPSEYLNILFNASVTEFSGSIADPQLRQIFIQTLAEHFQIDRVNQSPNTLVAVSPTLYLPQSKTYLYNAVMEDLAMRNRYMNDPSHHGHYKTCVLIEGGSGSGKSTLFIAALEAAGFSKDAQDSTKRYYHISGGSKDADDILIEAYFGGSAVIFDEFNLDKRAELLRNQLLSGTYRPPIKSTADTNNSEKQIRKGGFIVFGSQNSSTMKARQVTTIAVRDRVHNLFMDEFSDQDKEVLAGNINTPIAYPQMFSRAFKVKVNLYPKKANMRIYYKALNYFQNLSSKSVSNSNGNVNNNNSNQDLNRQIKKIKLSE